MVSRRLRHFTTRRSESKEVVEVDMSLPFVSSFSPAKHVAVPEFSDGVSPPKSQIEC
jgi:hypothetical protein